MPHREQSRYLRVAVGAASACGDTVGGRRHRGATWIAAWVIALAGCGEPRAAHPPIPAVDRSDGALPELVVLAVAEGAIRVDGHLDEPAWRGATNGTGALVDVRTGQPSPRSRVQGGAWLAWDGRSLYLAARIDDPSPDAPFPAAEHDAHVWERSSGIELMLQPGDPGDNRDYYEIQIDTGGARWTSRFDDYHLPGGSDPRSGAPRFGHQEWDPGLRYGVAVERAGGYYDVEISLPWGDLGPSPRASVPPRPGDIWRANVYSFRDGQSDALAWSPTLGRGSFHFAPRFGRLVFGGPVR